MKILALIYFILFIFGTGIETASIGKSRDTLTPGGYIVQLLIRAPLFWLFWQIIISK